MEEFDKNTKQMRQPGDNIYVTSHNQSGGITAYNVSITGSNSQRKLDDIFAAEILQALNNDKKIKVKISAVMGNQEAYTFAEEIRLFLVSKGWEIDTVGQAVFHKIPKGQIFQRNNDGTVSLLIGVNEN